MRVMVLVKASAESEAGRMPTERELSEMADFNDQLVRAGIMLEGEGLHPSSGGKRVSFSRSGPPTVTDGPFGEARELVAGFWLWRVKSMDEAVEWLKKAPFGEGDEVELRPVFEAEDFGEAYTPELREREVRQREEVERQLHS